MPRPLAKHIPFGVNAESAMQLLGISDIHHAAFHMHRLANQTKNTANARKLAQIYEQVNDRPFPHGIENAYIERFYPGHWQRSSGAWVWQLSSIRAAWRQDFDFPLLFGSQFPALHCIKNPKDIDG